MNIIKCSLLGAICLSLLVLFSFPMAKGVYAVASNYQYAFVRDQQLGFIDPSAPEQAPNWYTLTPDYHNIYPYVATSPDGRWIALGMTTPQQPTTKLELFNVLLGVAQPLIQVGNGFRSDYDEIRDMADLAQDMLWSPNSRYLALNMYGPNHADIYLYSVYDQTLTDLTALDVTSHYRMAWSSDSKQIVTESESCQNNGCISPLKLETLDLGGKTNHSIDLSNPDSGFGGGSLCNLGWSPDDQYIFFISSCDPISTLPKEIYLWNLAETRVKSITSFIKVFVKPADQLGSGAIYSILWRDPNAILIGTAFSAANTTTVYTQTILYKADSGVLTIVSPDFIDQWTTNPVSGQLAFRHTPQTNWGPSPTQQEFVRLGAINGTALQEASFPAASQIVGGCDLAWSPDGKYLAYTTRQGCATEHMTGVGFVDDTVGSVRQHLFPDDSKIKYYLPAGWVITPGQGASAQTPPPPVVLTPTVIPATTTLETTPGGLRD